MSLTRLDLRGRTPPFDGLLPAPRDAGTDVRRAVADVLARVETEGDGALADLTRRFDRVEVERPAVPPEELTAALERIPGELRTALEVAYRRIRDYHAFEARPGASVPEGDQAFTSDGIEVRQLLRPVGRAGCYAPGGLARYPSSVLMCAAPARVAGVDEVVLCVPPGPDGRVDDVTLAAAAVAGMDEVYAVGGAQAIGAMAFGTASIRRVDVIVGPGNAYVAEAKRQVSGVVGVASAFAGPSEVVVVAGPGADPALAAIDLVVQAEHGPDGLAWLVTWDPELLDAVDRAVVTLVERSPRRDALTSTFSTGGYGCLVDTPAAAIAVSNEVAPEHLELQCDEAEDLVALVTSAGAVFVGRWSPASLGDYAAGPNHVLPTNRSARFSSALRADDFRRHIHVVRATEEGFRALAPTVETLATAEGLEAHADSIRLRTPS